jgi:uncharacterized membrane protein YeaQ/YmgE (transglycosylase-associated protein family)
LGGIGVFVWIAIGTIAGWTVSRLMVGSDDDALRGTAAGMIGAVLGGLGLGLLEPTASVVHGSWTASVAALAGSLWLTWLTCVVTSGLRHWSARPEARVTTGDGSDDSRRRQAMPYAAARDQLVGELLRDAMAHDAERYNDVGRRFGSVEARLPLGGAPEFGRLRVAVTFWDGWIDARNRGWPADDGISRTDWPLLARTIAADLEGDRDVTDARVVTRFDVARFQRPGVRAQALAARLCAP